PELKHPVNCSRSYRARRSGADYSIATIRLDGHFLPTRLNVQDDRLAARSRSTRSVTSRHRDRTKYFVFGLAFDNRKCHLDIQSMAELDRSLDLHQQMSASRQKLPGGPTASGTPLAL